MAERNERGGKMSRLNSLESKVREVMKQNPATRDDDRVLALYLWVNKYGVDPRATITEVMENKNLPSQESIGRARRKIQEKDETMRGSKQKEKIRMAMQEEYIAYALESDSMDTM